MKNKELHILKNLRGFSLIELVVVIIIIGILSAVGIRSVLRGTENARVQETMREMEAIVKAVIGDQSLVSNGVRTDFGYVGDCGAWPTSPNNLITNPGYPNWRGPYISSGFSENPNDFIQDAWGNTYSFTATSVQSSGGGAGNLTKTIIPNINDALNNVIMGNILDWNGSSPLDTDLANFQIYAQLQSGGFLSYPTYVSISPGGVYTISNVHIGSHKVVGSYTGIANVDTIVRYVSVDLRSATRVDLRFATTFAGTGAGGGSGGSGTMADNFEVSGSTLINDDRYANGIRLTNISATENVRIEEIMVSWSDAETLERFNRIDINGTQVWSGGALGQSSGYVATLSSPYTLAPGDANLVMEIWWRSGLLSANPQGKNLSISFTLGDGSMEYYP